MRKFVLEIETNNAAFEHPGELPGLVRNVADFLSRGRTEGGVMDSNGNTVGTFQFLDDEPE